MEDLKVKSNPKICPFCTPDRELLFEDEYCFAIYDKYPVSDGHVLVVPKVHEPDYFSMEQVYLKRCWEMVSKAKLILDELYTPSGYNVGVNAGISAGQTIGHVHIHVIPRYDGDVEDPIGGVRNVIPGKGNYTEGSQNFSSSQK